MRTLRAAVLYSRALPRANSLEDANGNREMKLQSAVFYCVANTILAICPGYLRADWSGLALIETYDVFHCGVPIAPE